MADIVLFLACVLLFVAVVMIALDLRSFRKDYRTILFAKTADGFGAVISEHSRKLELLKSAAKGQGNSIDNHESRLAVLEAAMIADCEDCEDDEGEATDVEAVDTTGDIRSAGDVAADVLADPQRFDGGIGAVDVSGVLADRGTAGGAPAPVTPAYGDGFRLKGEQFDRAFDETYRR